MTIHVNIGDAERRLSELVAAAVRGEDVVLEQAGRPQVRLLALTGSLEDIDIAVAKRREKALGMFDQAGINHLFSLRSLKSDRSDPDERYRLKFDAAD